MGRKPPEYRTVALGGGGGGGGDVGSLLSSPSLLLTSPSSFFLYLPYPLLTEESSRLNEICFSKIVTTSAEPNRHLPSLYPDLVFGKPASLTSIVRAKNDF